MYLTLNLIHRATARISHCMQSCFRISKAKLAANGIVEQAILSFGQNQSGYMMMQIS